MTIRSVLLFTAGAAMWGVPARAQESAATFYLLSGKDTISVERVARRSDRVESHLFLKGGMARVDITVALTGGLARSADAAFFRAEPDTAPAIRSRVTFDGDSAGFASNGATHWVHVARGAIPYVNPSVASMEQIVMQARAAGGDSVALSILNLPAGPEAPVTVMLTRDSAIVRLPNVALRFAIDPVGHVLGGVIPAQQLQVVRGPATTGPVWGAPKSYAAPPGAPYTAQDVVVHTQAGLTLFGTLTLPRVAQGKRVPAIVTITGSGAEDRDGTSPRLSPAWQPYRQLADTLGRRGIAVLRMDDRGMNGSDTGPANATTADFADDIRAAVAFLRARPEIDPARVGLVGHSEGGTIAPMIAASDTAIAAVVVLDGAVSKGRTIIEYQNLYAIDSVMRFTGAQREAALAAMKSGLDSLERTNAWYRFFMEYDGHAAAARVRAPVLVIHGAQDRQVPVSEAEQLAAAVRAGGNRDVTVRVFPATNHLLVDDAGVGLSYEKLPSFTVRPELLGTIADWLVARLKP